MSTSSIGWEPSRCELNGGASVSSSECYEKFKQFSKAEDDITALKEAIKNEKNEFNAQQMKVKLNVISGMNEWSRKEVSGMSDLHCDWIVDFERETGLTVDAGTIETKPSSLAMCTTERKCYVMTENEAWFDAASKLRRGKSNAPKRTTKGYIYIEREF